MNTITFHSLFNDPDFTTLKHSLFYFDNIEIPKYNTIIDWREGEDNQNFRYIQLVPETVQDILTPLENAGVLKFLNLNYGPDEKIPELTNFILKEIHSTGVDRRYTELDVNEICKFIDMKPNDLKKLKTVDEFAAFLAALCIVSSDLNKKTCCIDNQIVFDSLNFGIERILNSNFPSNQISKIDIEKLKSNILAQKIITLNLPSFQFHSFDDVLDLKLKQKDNLLALDNYIFNMAKEIDTMPWEKNFSNVVDEFIKRRVLPEIVDLKNSIKSSPAKIANLLWEKGRINIGLSFGIYSVFPTMLETIILGTGIMTTVDVIKSLSQDRSKSLSHNPFNIFLKLNG